MSVVDGERATRRLGDGSEAPLGPKARRTREAILAAAAERFVAAGYANTTVADVAEAAGVSLGTVYQYFRDRSDLVAALVHRTLGDMRAAADTRWRAAEGLAGVERVLGNFVSFYEATAPFAGVWEEVSHLDGPLQELRRELGRAFTRAVEVELRAAGRDGLVDASLDPAITARALTGMVDRYCYVTYVFDPPPDGPPPAAESAAVLSRLWAAGLGLT